MFNVQWSYEVSWPSLAQLCRSWWNDGLIIDANIDLQHELQTDLASASIKYTLRNYLGYGACPSESLASKRGNTEYKTVSDSYTATEVHAEEFDVRSFKQAVGWVRTISHKHCAPPVRHWTAKIIHDSSWCFFVCSTYSLTFFNSLPCCFVTPTLTDLWNLPFPLITTLRPYHPKTKLLA